jgi:small-conductance mechanosensitive channel
MDDITQSFAAHSLNVIIILAVGGIAFFLGNLLLERLVYQIVKRTPQHHDWHPKDIEKRQNTLSALFTSIWRLMVGMVAIIMIFRELFPMIDLTPIFASAGIIGIALGFGAQSLIKDFLSGIFIISENQYRVGDVIDLDGYAGTVERIGTRSTVMRDNDGNVHYFPNGMVQHVINKTMGYSISRFTIDVYPSADIDQVITLINKTGRKLASEEKWLDKIIDPPAFVSVGAFTSKSVSLLIAGKTQPSDQWVVTAEMRRRLLHELEKNDIKLG